jgi:hypothetical protein
VEDQKILGLLRKSEAHYRVHKSPPLGPILSQTNLVHVIKPYSQNRLKKNKMKNRYIYIYIYKEYKVSVNLTTCLCEGEE